MATIKLLNLESPSSLSELSHEDTEGITGGFVQVASFVLAYTGGNASAARNSGRQAYATTLRRTGSRRRANAASLSSPK